MHRAKQNTMGQLIQRWTQKSNQRFKNWFKQKTAGIGQKIAGKAAGLYKTAVLDPQKQMNLELAQHQFDKNKEMWDLQNAYNSPSAQRERMEEAGFNPNYMASGGASSTGSASPASMPQYNVQAPTIDPMSFYSKIIGAAQGIMSLRQGMANVRKTIAQTGKTGTETDFLRDTAGVRKGNLWQYQSSQQAQEGLARQLHAHRGGYKPGDTITDYAQKGGLFDKQKTALDEQIEAIKANRIFQQHRNELMRKYNITTSDNLLFRMGIKALDTIGIDPSSWLKSGAEGLSNYMRSK